MYFKINYLLPVRALVFLAVAVLFALPSCSLWTPSPKILLVGVDGADWKVIGSMIEAGELPNFARLKERGASCTSFDVVSGASPIAWTCVATGRLSKDHGIRGFTTKLPNGDLIPVSSNQRSARAIWEIATENQLTVGVIGWWASWPAEEVNGYVITDHANPASTEFFTTEQKYWTADERALAAMQQDFYPSDLDPVLERAWISREDFSYEELQRRSRLTPTQLDLLKQEPWNERSYYSFFKTFYRVDFPHFQLSRRLIGKRPTDLHMLYLRGPDPIQHYAWDLVEPEKFPNRPYNLERDRGLVEGVYRYVDSFLGDLLELVGSETWIVVASDHGSDPNPSFEMRPRHRRSGEHTLESKGVLFLAGPHIVQGAELDDASPYDLMPTLCWLLGLPIAEDLEGEVLTEAFEADFVDGQQKVTVATYGPRPTKPLVVSPKDSKLLEQLRSLGYVK